MTGKIGIQGYLVGYRWQLSQLVAAQPLHELAALAIEV